MKKIAALLILGALVMGSFSCKSKKKCPAYSNIHKTEVVTKA